MNKRMEQGSWLACGLNSEENLTCIRVVLSFRAFGLAECSELSGMPAVFFPSGQPFYSAATGLGIMRVERKSNRDANASRPF